MDEGLGNAWHGFAFQIATRFAQFDAVQSNLADQEITAHQVVERDALGEQISAGHGVIDSESRISGHGGERFLFDERDGGQRLRNGLSGVPVARQALGVQGQHLCHRCGRLAGRGGDPDGEQSALKHGWRPRNAGGGWGASRDYSRPRGGGRGTTDDGGSSESKGGWECVRNRLAGDGACGWGSRVGRGLWSRPPPAAERKKRESPGKRSLKPNIRNIIGRWGGLQKNQVMPGTLPPRQRPAAPDGRVATAGVLSPGAGVSFRLPRERRRSGGICRNARRASRRPGCRPIPAARSAGIASGIPPFDGDHGALPQRLGNHLVDNAQFQ